MTGTRETAGTSAAGSTGAGRSGGLVEAGEAFMELAGDNLARSGATHVHRGQWWGQDRNQEGHLDVVVIGGGQAGLSVGHHLSRQGLRFVILDADARVGDVWRRRWDSLRLFTPARLDGLDGLPFPAPPNSFPKKDEMADYLEAYAKHFALPVRSGVKVEKLTRTRRGFRVKAGWLEFEADQVVVATGGYRRPRTPEFAPRLDAGIVQLTASEYRAPSQLAEGDVLIVGAANSGAEIAHELSKTHRVHLSGPATGEVPFRIDGWAARLFLATFVLRFVFHHLLTIRTPFGRRMRGKNLHRGTPLIRVKLKDLVAVGVERVPRVVAVSEGKPVLEDGRVLDVSNVIWCTGYRPDFAWIDLPVFDRQGDPLHRGGVVDGEPGLYFVGLHFLYAMSSGMVHGVGRDAARLVDAIAARARATPRITTQPAALSVTA